MLQGGGEEEEEELVATWVRALYLANLFVIYASTRITSESSEKSASQPFRSIGSRMKLNRVAWSGVSISEPS